MKRTKLWGGALLCAVLALPAAAHAQERGRTDGPEGSEVGKGGYEEPSGLSRYSVSAEWGAAVLGDSPTYDAPIFVGLTGTWWLEDYLLFDLTGLYVFRDGRYGGLAGPRFRVELGGMPVALSAGVRAGAMQIPLTGLRFVVSPVAGAEAMMQRRNILFGLFYAPDIPVGGGSVNHRLYISLGYRF